MVRPGNDILAELLVFQLQCQKTRWWPPQKQFCCLTCLNINNLWPNMWCVCNFQTRRKKKHKMENISYFFSQRISLFTKSIEGWVLCLLFTLGEATFQIPLGGSEESLTFQVVDALVLENYNLQVQMECSIRNHSYSYSVVVQLTWWYNKAWKFSLCLCAFSVSVCNFLPQTKDLETR